MTQFKVALILGSNRRESLNRRLARALEAFARPKAACAWARIDDLPMFSQDLEDDLPPAVVRFKAEIEAADALLFVTPEHNRSMPAVLKNAIDWGARPRGKNSWRGKVAALAGTSPGAIGTAAAQQHLRHVLGILGVLVMGGEAYLTFKPGLIDEFGTVADDTTRAFLQAYVDQFTALLARLSAR